MGIFNEQSFDHPFAKGIQGAPGVGFSLTVDGNYDMNKKRLTMLVRQVLILMPPPKSMSMTILPAEGALLHP